MLIFIQTEWVRQEVYRRLQQPVKYWAFTFRSKHLNLKQKQLLTWETRTEQVRHVVTGSPDITPTKRKNKSRNSFRKGRKKEAE